MNITACALVLLLVAPNIEDNTPAPQATDGQAKIQPLVRTVDLNSSEATKVVLANGEVVRVKLLSVKENRDSIRAAVRRAHVTVEIDGRRAVVHSATYHLLGRHCFSAALNCWRC